MSTHKFQIICLFCEGTNTAEEKTQIVHLCLNCLRPNFEPVWTDIVKPAPQKYVNKKNHSCSGCGAARWTSEGVCKDCLKRARQTQAATVAHKYKCLACGKPCTAKDGNCRACYNATIRGIPRPVKQEQPKVETISPSTGIEKLQDWLIAKDYIIGRTFLNLGKRNKRNQYRAAKGLILNINAQKRNARKGGELNFQFDLTPLREIINDAVQGVFWFEANERERKAERTVESFGSIAIYQGN